MTFQGCYSQFSAIGFKMNQEEQIMAPIDKKASECGWSTHMVQNKNIYLKNKKQKLCSRTQV